MRVVLNLELDFLEGDLDEPTTTQKKTIEGKKGKKEKENKKDRKAGKERKIKMYEQRISEFTKNFLAFCILTGITVRMISEATGIDNRRLMHLKRGIKEPTDEEREVVLDYIKCKTGSRKVPHDKKGWPVDKYGKRVRGKNV